MKVPFVDLQKEQKTLKKSIEKAMNKVIKKGNFILGEEVSAFEKSFAKYLGVKYVIGVASGTDALVLSLKALEIGLGDEVIVPSLTFIATALAVSITGATPVFVDVEKETHVIDPEKIEKKITKKTKAIIPVHLYGNPANLNKIMAIAKKYKLFVIEDAAQAHGAIYKGKKAGTYGDLSCFSFYPTKNLGAYGDAGAVATNSSVFAAKIGLLRNYGQKKKYYSKVFGYNSRLDELQSAVLSLKLSYLDEWNNKRRLIAKRYKQKLEKLVQIPKETEYAQSVFHLFPILVEKRDLLIRELGKKGIVALIHYPIPLHLQKTYSSLKYKSGDFPISEEISKKTLSLPIHPFMEERDVDYVVKNITKILKNKN